MSNENHEAPEGAPEHHHHHVAHNEPPAPGEVPSQQDVPAVVESPPVAVATAPVTSDDEVDSVAAPGETGNDTTVKEKFDALEPNPNAELSSPCSSELTEKIRAKFMEFETIGMLNVPRGVFEAIVDEIPNLNLADSEDGQKWLALVEEGQQYLLRGTALLNTLTRPESLWRQTVRYGAEELKPGRPRFGDNTDPNNLISGERAAEKMKAVMGLGAIVQVPLWHTGIWVSLKAPSEAELLELERRMGMEKIALGRYTNGLIFSNSAIYSNTYLINLVLSKVYDATVKDISLQALKEIIKLTDLPTLVWGMACTIWPGGYQYKQPCTADPATCQHVMEELLNLGKLSWTDNRALNDAQLKHMSNRNAKVTAAQLEAYQAAHRYQDNRMFTIGNETMTVELRVPSLNDYELSGFDWVDSIVQQTDQAFGTTMSDDERNTYILNQGRATALRQYSHWVERLVLANDQGVMVDRATVENAIGNLSADGEIQKQFFEGVKQYIDDTTVSMIAVPRYECPNCHKDSHAESKAHPHLVPLDVSRVFFTLLGHRSFKVSLRSLV